MILTVAFMILWIWFWIKFVIVKKFPFMDRVNQLLLGLAAGIVTQLLLNIVYLLVFVK